MLRNISEECVSHLLVLRGGNLKSRLAQYVWNNPVTRSPECVQCRRPRTIPLKLTLLSYPLNWQIWPNGSVRSCGNVHVRFEPKKKHRQHSVKYLVIFVTILKQILGYYLQTKARSLPLPKEHATFWHWRDSATHFALNKMETQTGGKALLIFYILRACDKRVDSRCFIQAQKNHSFVASS
jgi:hypothetical protein